jgi:S-adenosylmethionine synthetase
MQAEGTDMTPHAEPHALALAEWVLPGHPDKLCDAVAERCVGEVLRIDPKAQCGIEVGCAFEHVFITGLIGYEVSRRPGIAREIEHWVRDTYASAGYGDSGGGRWAPAPADLKIHLDALRIEDRQEEWRALRHLSDDQCICIGYAQATPDTGHLPGAHWLARRLARRLHELQRERHDGFIGPDGKVIVRGEEDAQARFTPRSVSMSLHHREDADWMALRAHAEQALCDVLGHGHGVALELNGAGMFICGGPTGDNGSTGKKLVMDAYGPGIPIGGGAWYGKDPHKPDRAGGLLARQLALQCVKAGLGLRVRVQLEYRPNSAAPESVQVWADGVAVPLPAHIRVPGTKEVAEGFLTAERIELLRSGEFARWGGLLALG